LKVGWLALSTTTLIFLILGRLFGGNIKVDIHLSNFALNGFLICGLELYKGIDIRCDNF
jgi:hypothetical protein